MLRRRRGSAPRTTTAAASVAALALGLAATACYTPPQMSGFSRAAAAEEHALETAFVQELDRDAVDADYRELTRRPHPAGSERTRELAEWIAERFRQAGLEQVRIHRYDVLLPWPERVQVQMLTPRHYVPSLREEPYPEDPDTRLDVGPTYLGMSASADVTGALVYAHSGNPEDYDWLESQGIDLRGKIAIVRYSVPYSYRGFKAWEAERRGVAALLVYSDPMEDGHLKGPVYPEGPWGPDSHIQRGAITYDFLVPGDPLTPGWASLEGAPRIALPQARSVPRIAAVPMSARDAQPLLEALGGPEAPAEWQGGLPITYRVGGEGTSVHVLVQMDDAVRPIWVVEGRLVGGEWPDELVVLGNHHDAWVFGGVDPSSGTATMLELARRLGALAASGHRPRRTIVFGAWDAEEWHLTGSTEWGEQFADQLEGAVAYLNVDSSTSGPDFSASGVASLNRLLVEVARDSRHPVTDEPLLQAWRAVAGGDAVIGTAARRQAAARDDLDLVGNELGSGSDYTVFLNRLGVPIVDMTFDGPYGVYHSMYDDYFRMTRIVDPGLRIMTGMAEVWGRAVLRLANAEILPLDFVTYADRVGGFVEAVAEPAAAAGLDLEPLRERVARWRAAAEALDASVAAALERDISRARAQRVNRRLRQVERAFLLEQGIPGRPWFRHALYAPRYTYAAMSLPGITEALESGDLTRAREQAERLAAALDRAIEAVESARSELAGQ